MCPASGSSPSYDWSGENDVATASGKFSYASDHPMHTRFYENAFVYLSKFDKISSVRSWKWTANAENRYVGWPSSDRAVPVAGRSVHVSLAQWFSIGARPVASVVWPRRHRDSCGKRDRDSRPRGWNAFDRTVRFRFRFTAGPDEYGMRTRESTRQSRC